MKPYKNKIGNRDQHLHVLPAGENGPPANYNNQGPGLLEHGPGPALANRAEEANFHRHSITMAVLEEVQSRMEVLEEQGKDLNSPESREEIEKLKKALEALKSSMEAAEANLSQAMANDHRRKIEFEQARLQNIQDLQQIKEGMVSMKMDLMEVQAKEERTHNMLISLIQEGEKVFNRMHAQIRDLQDINRIQSGQMVSAYKPPFQELRRALEEGTAAPQEPSGILGWLGLRMHK